MDEQKLKERQTDYAISFEERAQNQFDINCECISLQDLGVSDIKNPEVTEEQLDSEVNFLKWLFGNEGPYKGIFPLSDRDYKWMTFKKFELYGSQGWIVTELMGGIVLQTETPWLLRTQMLQCTGAPVSAIYPWIRKEEL